VQASSTPYPGVNVALAELSAAVQAVLGSHFVGMYLYGSLALGGFDPSTSDIDFIVVTDKELPDSIVDALEGMHARFAVGGSPWSARIEAAYIPRDAVHIDVSATERYPQIERERPFGRYPVESGWVIQLYTLREHGVVIAGPDPRNLVAPIAANEVRRVSAAHAVIWAEQARHEAAWLDWARQREAHAFVVLTLCRMLYSLETGRVASKPRAARWVVETMGSRWSELTDGALARRGKTEAVVDRAVQEMVAFVEYVARRYEAWRGGERQ
jgi:hypothetical protein